MLRAVENLFQTLIPNYSPEPSPAKLKYLTRAMANLAPEGLQSTVIYYEVLDKFLIKFNYHREYLAQHPEVKKVRLSPELARQYNKSCYRFYGPGDAERIKTFTPEQFIEPQKGKTYIIAPNELEAPLVKKAKARRGAEGIFTFHEKTLPEIFGQLGLTYKPVLIRASYDGRRKSATAWLITAGLKELQATPRPSFATGPELKVDSENLPRLQTALEKFGLAPTRVKVVNDWICGAGAPRLGKYDPGRDAITLSSPSLSLAAHEGLHRLVAQGLVPPREYRSLVKAGRGWAAAHPAQAESRLNLGASRHGPPPEEYAALFVEKYYEQESTARKYLMGQKVPMFERLVRYIKETRDILGAALGYAPARARNFFTTCGA